MSTGEPTKKPSNAPSRSDDVIGSVGEFLDSTEGKLLGAVGAAGATLVTARDAIGRAYFKSMNKPGADAFTDLQHERDLRIGEVVAPVKHGIPVPDAMDKVNRINHQYDSRWAERRKMLGVHSVFDEAKALKRHQWMEVMLSTSAVAAVALGAIFTIASSRDILHKNEEESPENTR